MTLSGRNALFKTGIVFSCLVLLGILQTSPQIIGQLDSLCEQAQARPLSGRFLAIFGRGDLAQLLFGSAPLMPYVVSLCAVVFAAGTLLFIYYYFEVTQSPEIFFFACFALSVCFEAFRMVLPLRSAMNLPIFLTAAGGRIVLFGRFAGLFSFLAASIYTAGLKTQKENAAFAPVCVVALVLARAVTLDTLSWDRSLVLNVGDGIMFPVMELCVALLCAATFLIAAWQKSSRDYVMLALAAVLCLAGRALFANADAWSSFGLGFVMLCAGSWLFCRRLHTMYLWV
jgi:hypothetical protein